MRQVKPQIIPYYKYKQKAFWKFNNALANLIHHNGVCQTLSVVG